MSAWGSNRDSGAAAKRMKGWERLGKNRMCEWRICEWREDMHMREDGDSMRRHQREWGQRQERREGKCQRYVLFWGSYYLLIVLKGGIQNFYWVLTSGFTLSKFPPNRIWRIGASFKFSWLQVRGLICEVRGGPLKGGSCPFCRSEFMCDKNSESLSYIIGNMMKNSFLLPFLQVAQGGASWFEPESSHC